MLQIEATTPRNPRVGMLAIVRKRRAVISEVRPFDGQGGVLHLVRLNYKDDFRPETEELIWELEPARRLLEPNELPRASDPPMPVEDFDALVRSARWTAISPYLDPDADGPLERLPISSPFHGAVQVEDYQLIPLLKALQMPRINLFIADDVGIGKTIEAGLILSELLLRRRIQRVLIITPASLRIQWRDEMWSKFSLRFDVVDRDSTLKLKRSLGIDANPWRSCPRIISSYYYLKQPDVLEQFRSACRTQEGSPHLPWDLLIVDEVHNLMPAPFGEDSELCKLLRMIAPQFEHRLFLTATPHNGHTRCFSGLLELLDPVRFSRTDELKPAEKERVKQIVIRRLKREINARTNPPRFCTRKPPEALILNFSTAELQLIKAVGQLRAKVRSVIAGQTKKRRLAGTFAIEILGKRLLSGPVTFADSWRRCKLGLAEEEPAGDNDVVAAEKTVHEDTSDDREYQQREATASAVIGAWLKALAGDIEGEILQTDQAVKDLGLDLDQPAMICQNPTADSRYEKLCKHIEQLLKNGNEWKPDERLVVFTEYKTTLDYLLRRLRQSYPNSDDRFLCLYGGMDDIEREQIKEKFNDPDASVRVLVATDAASEGLNLQTTARFLLHFDCPWNPARLEQRNGRLDRHGQARDVQIYHFASDDDADLKFMSYLVNKVDQIREDLGAVGELLDEATYRRLIDGDDAEVVQSDLDRQIEAARGAASVDADDTTGYESAKKDSDYAADLDHLAQEIDLDPHSQHDTLEAAMAMYAGRPQLSESDDQHRYRILNPGLQGWSDTIDETVRRTATGGGLGPVPYLAFDTVPFIKDIGGRLIFRPRVDTMMVHLAHPLMGKALSSLTRRRFPGPHAVSRWIVRLGDLPNGLDALVLLHLEELGVNQLRETFHHWIRTVQIPIRKGQFGSPLAHAPAMQFRGAEECRDPVIHERARNLMDDIEPDLQNLVKTLRNELTEKIKSQLKLDGQQAHEAEEQRYRSRQGEVSALITENTLAKLEREVIKLKAERAQGRLFESQYALADLERSIEAKQQELERRRTHYEEVREQLARERERILNRVLPKRYAMEGEAQIFPVAVEIRFPRTER